MGLLILPLTGLVYIDASGLIYSMERVACQGRSDNMPARRREIVPPGATVQHKCQC